MAGMLADSYFPNTSNCFQRLTNFTFLQIPHFQYTFDNVIEQGETDPTKVVSAYYSASVYSTRLIQNATNHLWVCNSAVKNVYKWMNFKYLQFNGGFTDVATAFFQNLLSKVISINNIYNAIQAKQLVGDNEGIYFDLARLVRILMDFSPVEAASAGGDEDEGVALQAWQKHRLQEAKLEVPVA
jgi:hypothetical protein